MDLITHNLDFLKIFIRDLNEFDLNSEKLAQKASEEIRDIIIARVQDGRFVGGVWANKPYSSNPIKAFKLGNINVTAGKRGERDLSINGVVIDKDDWHWGGYDPETRSIRTESGREIPDPFIAPAPLGGGGDFNSHNISEPSPVFIPGYKEWVIKYNGLSQTVDLDFSGRMIDNFDVITRKVRGSNRYGGQYLFELEVEEPFKDIGGITDFYRKWLTITEEEVARVATYLGDAFSSFK